MTTIPAWAVKGAKVVCVVAPRLRPTSAYDRKCKAAIVGETYTIRATKLICGTAGVWLEEIVNPIGAPHLGYNGETGFYLACFRPLASQADDIATHFQHHLDHVAPADLERV